MVYGDSGDRRIEFEIHAEIAACGLEGAARKKRRDLSVARRVGPAPKPFGGDAGHYLANPVRTYPIDIETKGLLAREDVFEDFFLLFPVDLSLIHI